MSVPRRAVAVRAHGSDSGDIDRLCEIHGLRVVFTAYIGAGSVHAPMIAAHHALDHDADVVLVPHLGIHEARSPSWRTVTRFADLITAAGVLESGS
ncbi:hypothetical protein ABZV91_13010 [Nocardia sp. NPDC004568]|uniref:hypothetical protein n=1 Tax=Nocardia sp. NPDC004568 TaxID=3154551 RepID=UPI0033B5BD96